MYRSIYMALDALKGAAQSLSSRALKKVAGNIRDGLLGKINTGNINIAQGSLFGSKFKTKNYAFPLDVESATPGIGNQGHYMMFYIRVQSNTKLIFGDAKRQVDFGSKNMKKAANEMGISGPEDAFAAQQKSSDKVMADAALAGSTKISPKAGPPSAADAEKARLIEKFGQTVGLKRPPTVRTDTGIAMYMPPQVTAAYNANYIDQEIGAASNIDAGAYQEYLESGKLADVTKNALKALGPEISEGLVKFGIGAASFIPGLQGAQETIDVQRGFVQAPQLEIAFKGVAKRTFQYTFTMLPKSEEEAEMVQNIVGAFKAHMLPEMEDGTVRRLTIPDFFDIEYMYNGGLNRNLHQIGSCVLENMNVSYGGDRYKAFANGMPMVTNLTLNFKELNLVTRQDALQGF